MLTRRMPTFESYAKCRGESVYPHLWDGLLYGWSPFLGPQPSAIRPRMYYNNSAGNTFNRNGLNLTATWGSGAGFPLGTAPTFNGTSEWGQSGFAVDLSGTPIVTLSIWFYMVAYKGSGFECVLEHGASWFNTNGFSFFPRDTAEGSLMTCGVGGSTTGYYVRVGSAAPSLSAWHHALVGYDRPNRSTAPIKFVYLDGVLQSLAVQATGSGGNANFASNNLNLAARNGGASAFTNCYIGDIFIYGHLGFGQKEASLFAAGASPLSKLPTLLLPQPLRRRFLGVPTGIAFDAASNSGVQTAVSTYTWSHTCTGSNRYLGVDVSLLSAGATVTAITYNGVNLSFIGGRSTVTSFGRVECWGLANPASGSNTISVTLSGSITSVGEAVSYTGVHQTSPTEAFNSNQATNGGSAVDATVDVTPVANNCWIHSACATTDGSITANQTSRNNVSSGVASGANEDTGPISPAALTTTGWTGVGSLQTWVVGGYAIRPVAAGSLFTGGDEDGMLYSIRRVW